MTKLLCERRSEDQEAFGRKVASYIPAPQNGAVDQFNGGLYTCRS
jgi:hypothetical protein